MAILFMVTAPLILHQKDLRWVFSKANFKRTGYRKEVEALNKKYEKYMIKDEEGDDDEADGFAE